MTTRDEMKKNFQTSHFHERTTAAHKEQIKRLESYPNGGRIYGVKKNSILNSLQYYHVCWGLPSDLSHDIFEGFGIDLLQMTLNRCIINKYFSLEELNNQIKSFPYSSYDKVNKPGLIYIGTKKKLSIKQTAAQCCCLLHLLPLLIAHKIPLDDPQWLLYLMFLNILDFILAPALYKGEIQALSTWIEEFVHDLYNLNDEWNIKPKGHFLLHYAKQFLYFGPIIHQSTMRYEGKHAYLKGIFSHVKNYINPCLTMARKHQLYQNYHHNAADYLEKFHMVWSKKVKKYAYQLSEGIPELVAHLFDEDNLITLYECVRHLGIRYEKGCALILSKERVLQFAKIDYCLQVKDDLCFLVELATYKYFKPHLHSHIVTLSKKRKLIKHNILLSNFNLPMYATENEEFIIVMKHHLH